MQRHRFLLLGLVPHEHAIRQLVNQPLGRQVIPAAHTEHALDPQLPGTPDVVDLVGTEVQERRQHQDIRLDTPEDGGHLVRRREYPFGRSKQAAQDGQAGTRSQQRHSRQGNGEGGRLIGRTAPEFLRVSPSGIEIAPVVERRANACRQRIPEPVSARREQFEGDRGMVGREKVCHLAAVNGVCPFGQQMQVMPTFGQKANRRLEVSEEPEMRGRKEDLHPDIGTLAWRGTGSRPLTYR